uniref:BHLH domain-containing protein n=1 Tax=Ascaris lumbricoides TaxID=6252 RepID=A0A0M3I1V7_ASCLU
MQDATAAELKKLSKAERRKRRRATPKYRNLHASRERDYHIAVMIIDSYGHRHSAPYDDTSSYHRFLIELRFWPQLKCVGDRCTRKPFSCYSIRVESFNNAFARLRALLPTLPLNKKLSKIEILRLSISYISYLDTLLTF